MDTVEIGDRMGLFHPALQAKVSAQVDFDMGGYLTMCVIWCRLVL